jgi:hypothetical protein
MRIDFADQEDVFAAAFYRLADDFLGAAFAIHFGRIDKANAQIEPEPQRGNFGPAVSRLLAHAPGALPQHRHGAPGPQSQIYLFLRHSGRGNVVAIHTAAVAPAYCFAFSYG